MVTPKKAKKKDGVAKKTNIKKPAVKKTGVKKEKDSKSQQEKPLKNNSEKNKTTSSLVLSAVVVINDVKTLHEDLSNLSTSQETVTLDASKVEMIDTAAFQLLLAFVSTMSKKNIGLVWKDPSDTFLERASILDLTDALRLVKA